MSSMLPKSSLIRVSFGELTTTKYKLIVLRAGRRMRLQFFVDSKWESAARAKLPCGQGIGIDRPDSGGISIYYISIVYTEFLSRSYL